jgi:hypothetical protein
VTLDVNAQTAKASYDNAKADYARYENALKQVALQNNN